jgi:hypothetical protein
VQERGSPTIVEIDSQRLRLLEEPDRVQVVASARRDNRESDERPHAEIGIVVDAGLERQELLEERSRANGIARAVVTGSQPVRRPSSLDLVAVGRKQGLGLGGG